MQFTYYYFLENYSSSIAGEERKQKKKKSSVGPAHRAAVTSERDTASHGVRPLSCLLARIKIPSLTLPIFDFGTLCLPLLCWLGLALRRPRCCRCSVVWTNRSRKTIVLSPSSAPLTITTTTGRQGKKASPRLLPGLGSERPAPAG